MNNNAQLYLFNAATNPRPSAAELQAMKMDELLLLTIRWLVTAELVSQARASVAAAAAVSPGEPRRRGRQLNGIYESTQRALHQHVLRLFVRTSWRRPVAYEEEPELQKQQLPTEWGVVLMSRSMLLSIANRAMSYAGFEHELAFKSEIWCSAVASYLDKQQQQQQPTGYAGTALVANSYNKTAKDLPLIEMRSTEGFRRFLDTVRAYFLENITRSMQTCGLLSAVPVQLYSATTRNNKRRCSTPSQQGPAEDVPPVSPSLRADTVPSLLAPAESATRLWNDGAYSALPAASEPPRV